MAKTRPDKITIHCSSSPNGKPLSVAEITRWHLERGFNGIGYHYVIDVGGTCDKGRPIMEQGAHVSGANKGNIGICLVGEDRFSRAQFISLRGLLHELFRSYDILPKDLYCHYQFESARKQGKTCPNIPINVIHRWYFGEDDAAIAKYLL